MITNIKIENLKEHPDNPRLNIGDVTELADSIKKNGVLQNLTVVPNDDDWTDFTVIIGHRRLAAAKVAGMKELPCSIVEMTPQEQMKTMLMENMQREDLTPYEQANGFQMMMNLGTTKADISKETGFSQTTINHRLKLLDLDKDILQDSQLTISQLIKLEEIEDPEEKNRVLKEAPDGNFDNIISNVLREQAAKKKTDSWVQECKDLGIDEMAEDDYAHSWDFGNIRSLSAYGSSAYGSVTEILNVNELSAGEVQYALGYYGTITLYTKEKISVRKKTTPEEKAENKWRKICESSEDALTNMFENAAKRREAFFRQLMEDNVNIDMSKLMRVFVRTIISNVRGLPDREGIATYLDEDVAEDLDRNEYLQIIDRNKPEYAMLAIIFIEMENESCAIKDSNETNWCRCVYRKNEHLEAFYEYLGDIGYIPEQWERDIMTGRCSEYITEEEAKAKKRIN